MTSRLFRPGLLRRRVLLAGTLFLTACASAPRYPVDTELGFVPLSTTVDSTLAARFLRWFRGSPRPSPDTRIATLRGKYDARAMSNESLLALAEESSTDFAATYFIRRTLAVPHHREMQRRFAQRLTRIRASDEPRKATEAESRFVFVFVPGLFYKSRPQTGAAMERPRQLLQRAGFETRLVPTDESDTVEKNARLLADYLRAARAWHRPLILVSASKGGAEVAHALGGILAGKNLEHVRGWVSIGGILRGTPLADGGLEWPTNWLLGLTGWVHGTSLGWVKSVSTGPSGRRAATHVFPTHLQVLHYVGVPLSGSVSDAVRGRYKKLRRYGPTDGITRLPDQILPQGHIVLAVGSDHRFVDPEFDKKALALAELILELVDPSP